MAGQSIRKGKGRQKIKMEKMENESNLRVTFTKRRNNVFKKAHELTILTGVEVAVIVFSPGKKVYTYAHPSIDTVTERVLTGRSPPQTLMEKLVQVQCNTDVAELSAKLASMKNMLDFEISRGESLDRQLGQGEDKQSDAGNMDVQSLAQLQQSALALKNLIAELEKEINSRFQLEQQAYGSLLAMPLVGDTYNGNGSGLPFLPRAISSASRGIGSGFLSIASLGVAPNPASLQSFGNGGTWPFSAGPSSFGGAGPFTVGPSYYTTNAASSSGVGKVYGGSFDEVLE